MEVSKDAVIVENGVYYSSVKCVNPKCPQWEIPINTNLDTINNRLKKFNK